MMMIRLLLCLSLVGAVTGDVTIPLEWQYLPAGRRVCAPTPQPELYHDDLLHPCVRYIEGGMDGASWWMVATPYFKSRSAIENPILFRGEGGVTNVPPSHWLSTAVVEPKPSPQGAYNSDPNLYYDGEKLWVVSRPAYADYSASPTFAVYARSTTDGVTFSDRKLLLTNSFAGNEGEYGDNVMSPTVVERNGRLYIYSVAYCYSPTREFRAIAIWENKGTSMDDCDFQLLKYVHPTIPQGFDFWHCDYVEADGNLLCIVTNEKGTKMLLGASADGENFVFDAVPLISKRSCGATYAYKATAQIVDRQFYLWYPNKNRFNKVRYIHQSSLPLDELRSHLLLSPTVESAR